MADVLRRLGGIDAGDLTLLLDARVSEVRARLDEVAQRLAEARARGERTLFLFYFSGHARDGSLRLGDGRLPLEEVQARLDALPADVRIGILDSCRSGLVNRIKGAYRAPAFEVSLDGSSRVEGTVILTSSSADEDSQESDHLGGSYFTHNLVSGLQGDADASGDGRVTLSEAYTYAYARTVAATAETSAGPQHPTFAYDLSGNDDVVITDLSRRREGVILDASAPAGTYFLVDGEGRVRAEITKTEGVARRVAVPPGRYQVKRRLPDRLRIGTLVVEAGRATRLRESALHDASFSDDPVKGVGRRHAARGSTWEMGVGWLATFQAPTTALFPSAPFVEVRLARRGIFGPGWALAPGVALASTEASAHLDAGGAGPAYAFLGLIASLGILRSWPGPTVTPYAGGSLAWRFYLRRFEDPTFPSQTFATFTPGLVAGARLRLGRAWRLGVQGRLYYLHYSVDEDLSLGLWDVSVVVAYRP